MHMHATTGDGTFQSTLIRQCAFVSQYRREAGLTAIFT
jgi:hypothetical protein